MGERRLVALLKELLSLNRASLFYKHFTATRFSRQPPSGGFPAGSLDQPFTAGASYESSQKAVSTALPLAAKALPLEAR